MGSVSILFFLLLHFFFFFEKYFHEIYKFSHTPEQHRNENQRETRLEKLIYEMAV